MLNGMTTRSPGLMWVTSAPTSSTMPIGSCPRMSPGSMYIPRTSYRCRSDPQMAVEVIRTIASVGSWMTGSGTVSTDTLPVPCHVSARMKEASVYMSACKRLVKGYPPPDRVCSRS
jgi:hypothetical protein